MKCLHFYFYDEEFWRFRAKRENYSAKPSGDGGLFFPHQARMKKPALTAGLI